MDLMSWQYQIKKTVFKLLIRILAEPTFSLLLLAGAIYLVIGKIDDALIIDSKFRLSAIHKVPLRADFLKKPNGFVLPFTNSSILK
jgi:hypothetical protein